MVIGAAVFIDAGYFERVLDREFPGTRIDYARLAPELVPRDVPLLRTYYYNCPPYQGNPPSRQERARKSSADRFYAALARIERFEVRLGRLALRECPACTDRRPVQKRVDTLLCADLVRLASKRQISHAVLVAGDSDFLPAIWAARQEGVGIRLFHGGPQNPPHGELRSSCDETIRLDRDLLSRLRRWPR